MIDEIALKLNQAIKDSEEYSRYQTTMVRLMQHQELYQAVNIFKRRNCELQGYDNGSLHHHNPAIHNYVF